MLGIDCFRVREKTVRIYRLAGAGLIPQDGVVLIIVLLFLQLFTLMSLYALANSALMMKLQNQAWLQNQVRDTAEYLLRHQEENFRENLPACSIAPVPLNWMSKQTLVWWEMAACAGNFSGFRYYYVVENLGQDLCEPAGTEHRADYYRLSLLLIPAVAKAYPVLLQSTLQYSCATQSDVAALQRQSWRELNTNASLK